MEFRDNFALTVVNPFIQGVLRKLLENTFFFTIIYGKINLLLSSIAMNAVKFWPM